MEYKITNSQEIACYIDILKRLLSIIDEDITGEGIFYLINGYRIVYNNWLGYDYQKEFQNLSFIQKMEKGHNSIRQFILQPDIYGVVLFTDSKVLTYNEIYRKNAGKTHCVRIIDSSQENITIEDTHIRINDKIIKFQIAELLWKEFDDIEADIFVIDIQKMYEEFKTRRMMNNMYELDKFFNSNGYGLNAIEQYLNKKDVTIDCIPMKYMIKEIQNIYYDIKINSYVYVNKYIEEVYCNFCDISKMDFEVNYIKSMEKLIEKLIYFAIKESRNDIKQCIHEMLEVCEKERKEFNYVYRRNNSE